jgi:hypothetical protein
MSAASYAASGDKRTSGKAARNTRACALVSKPAATSATEIIVIRIGADRLCASNRIAGPARPIERSRSRSMRNVVSAITFGAAGYFADRDFDESRPCAWGWRQASALTKVYPKAPRHSALSAATLAGSLLKSFHSLLSDSSGVCAPLSLRKLLRSPCSIHAACMRPGQYWNSLPA